MASPRPSVERPYDECRSTEVQRRCLPGRAAMGFLEQLHTPACDCSYGCVQTTLPTSEAWIEPLVEYLRHAGVVFHAGHEVTGFTVGQNALGSGAHISEAHFNVEGMQKSVSHPCLVIR